MMGVGSGLYPACVRSRAFSPASLGTPRLVLDASQGVQLVGGLVASWDNLASGITIAQASAPARPSVLASDPAFGGAPSVVFAGAQWLASSAAPGASVGGYSLWAVVRFDASATTRTVIDTAAGGWVPFGILGLNGSNKVLYGSAGYGTTTETITDTDAHLIGWTLRNGAAPNLDVWLDGVQVVSDSAGYTDPWGANALQIGRDHTPWPWPLRGAIAALGLSGAPFTADDWEQLFAWASATKGV